MLKVGCQEAMKLKKVTTEHDVKSASDVREALIIHEHTRRLAGGKPASVDNVLEIELVSLVSGSLTIETRKIEK